MATPELGSWSRPEHAAAWLGSFPRPWWIAGGIALELFLGRSIRDHADLDVGVFRDTQAALHEALTGFELYAAHAGALRRLERWQAAGPEVHSLWCLRPGSRQWELEILLEHRDHEDWVFRRNPSIRLPIRRLTRTSARGIDFLGPEIQLLYKARGRRPRDETDFRAVVPALDGGARAWLRDALASTHPGHPWLERLGTQ